MTYKIYVIILYTGHYRQVSAQDIYVYTFDCHVTCSSVKFLDFKNGLPAASVVEKETIVGPCNRADHFEEHLLLSP